MLQRNVFILYFYILFYLCIDIYKTIISNTIQSNCSLPCYNNGTCYRNINNTMDICICLEGFDPLTRCSTCLSNYFGFNCDPCPNCYFPNGNCVDGIHGNGRCSCAVGWDDSIDKNCSDCLPNFYGPNCLPCETCNRIKKGKCNHGIHGDGKCICKEGFDSKLQCMECKKNYYGKDCTLCDTCNNHGICNDTRIGDGNCICEEGYSIKSRCDSCDQGWDYNPSTKTCQCAPEHFGPHCISCPICAPHGKCNSGLEGDGNCICDNGWSDSNNCVGCMTNYYGFDCKPCKKCGYNIEKHFSTGRCDDGLRGKGTCICHHGWDPIYDCYECLQDYYGEKCQKCPEDCGKHGKCSSGLNGNGTCICDNGWTHGKTPCSICKYGYIGPNCLPCPGVILNNTFDNVYEIINYSVKGIPCSGHGLCTIKDQFNLNDDSISDIVCECDARYSGKKCDKYDFPLMTISILASVALAALGLCMCTMRKLAQHGGLGMEGKVGAGTGMGGGSHQLLSKNDYVEISDMADLEIFVAADSKDWLIPFESLTLQCEVGNGTSGQVFRSLYHTGGGSSVVAVKRLYSPVTGQEYFQNFFRREVSILNRLHHPNVVRFYGVSYYSRILYIVTDFCPTSLSDLIESPSIKGPFEQSFFLKIITQITSGMGFLHSRNVVHRDLKPANVLLTENDDVNICDFGLSRLIDPETTSMTAEVGTPSYMAPEMATMGGIKCSTKGDVYSFGILLYSLWTRSKPYGDQGMNPFQLMTAVVNGLRPVISVNVPIGLTNLMRSCWDVKPDNRPSFPEISLKLKDENLLYIPENKDDRTMHPRTLSVSTKEYLIRRRSKDYNNPILSSSSSMPEDMIHSSQYGSFAVGKLHSSTSILSPSNNNKKDETDSLLPSHLTDKIDIE